MNFDASSAARLLDACSAGIVLGGLLIAGTRSIGRAIWLVAAQAVLLSVAAIGVGVATGSPHLLIGGVLTFASRGVAVPLILGWILRQSPVRTERSPYLGPRSSLVVAIVIVFATAVTIDGSVISHALGGSLDAPRVLPVAVAEVLTGLLVAMTRRKGLSIVVGLLVFENGISLIAFSLTYGMPLVIELGVAFDLLMATTVIWVYTRRMLRTHGSLSTDNLRNLRG
jgi:hydrogenase-4 component E